MAKKFTCTCPKGYHYSPAAVDNCKDLPEQIPTPADSQSVPTREGWLRQAVELLRPIFAAEDLNIPRNLRVSTSLPRRKHNTGVCFSESVSGDGRWEIMISLVRQEWSEVLLLSTLTHELVHATVGLQCGHKGAFKETCEALGLLGPMKSTKPGPYFMQLVEPLLDQLGPFPGAKLNLQGTEKKQKTYLLKCLCESCGYVARVTSKWIEAEGAPLCPCNSRPMAT